MIKRTAIALVSLWLLTGCMAHKLSSPSMSANTDLAKLASLRTLSVSIIRPDQPSEKYLFRDFVENLRKADIFRTVDYEDMITGESDLYLNLISIKQTPDFLHACSLGVEGGIITVGTLGLIPQICTTNVKIRFSISSNSKKVDNFEIESEHKSVMGWLGLIYNISPEWTWRYPELQEQRLIQCFMEQNVNNILGTLK